MTRSRLLVILAAMLLLQLAYAVSLFGHPAEALSAAPLVNDDYPWQTWLVHGFRRFVFEDGQGWGYDPYFWAGFVRTFWGNNAKALQLLGIALPWLTSGQIAKLFVLGTFASVPALAYATGRWCGVPSRHALWAAGGATIYYDFGVPLVFTMWGMPAGALLIALAPAVLALFVAWCARPTIFKTLALAVALSCLGVLHKTSPVLIAPGALAALFTARATLGRRGVSMLVVAGALALAANWYWLEPSWHARHYVDLRAETSALGGGGVNMLARDFFVPEHGVWASQYLGLIALVGGALGLVFVRTNSADRRRLVRASWASAALVLLALLYLSPHVAEAVPALKALYARRWLPHVLYLLVLPAGWWLAQLFLAETPRPTKGRLSGVFVPAMLGIGVVVAFWALPTYRDWFHVAPLTTRVDPWARRVMEALARDTVEAEVRGASPGRILVEGSTEHDREGPGHVWSGGHLPITFPLLTGRPMMGGLPPDFYLVYSRMGFNDGVLAGRDITTYARRELLDFCDAYNITDIVAWSSRAKAALNRFPEDVYVKDRFGLFAIYGLRGAGAAPGSYVMGGHATVTADMNGITVRDLELDPLPHGNAPRSITLKFHWAEFLRMYPPHPIRPVLVLNDPVPFIAIDDPPKNFRIYNSYTW